MLGSVTLACTVCMLTSSVIVALQSTDWLMLAGFGMQPSVVMVGSTMSLTVKLVVWLELMLFVVSFANILTVYVPMLFGAVNVLLYFSVVLYLFSVICCIVVFGYVMLA